MVLGSWANEWFVKMVVVSLILTYALRKAFDTIDDDIFLKRHYLYGLKKSALNLLKSYLTNRTQMCSVNGTFFRQKLIT